MKLFNHENKIIELQSIIIDLKTIKESTLTNKNEESIKILKKCRFYNVGYCRSKSSCSFSHPITLCKKEQYKDRECPNRHLKDCKNYMKSDCKFGKQCEFTHDPKKRIKINQKVTQVFENENTIEDIIVNFESTQSDESSKKDSSVNNQMEIPSVGVINEFDNKSGEENVMKQKELNILKTVDFSCDKCKFKTKNKYSLKRHVQSCNIDGDLIT